MATRVPSCDSFRSDAWVGGCRLEIALKAGGMDGVNVNGYRGIGIADQLTTALEMQQRPNGSLPGLLNHLPSTTATCARCKGLWVEQALHGTE